jgi:Ca2+-binding EF-hand superfamily protein
MDNHNLISLLTPEDQQAVDMIYAIGDKNLDGNLSKDEFKQMIQMMGQSVSDSELNTYWPFLDTNQDGLISKTELIALAEQNPNVQIPTLSMLAKKQ